MGGTDWLTAAARDRMRRLSSIPASAPTDGLLGVGSHRGVEQGNPPERRAQQSWQCSCATGIDAKRSDVSVVSVCALVE